MYMYLHVYTRGDYIHLHTWHVTLHLRCNLLHIARVQQIYAHSHTPTHICLPLFICMPLCIRVYIYTYVCLLCMYVYIYIYIYIYILLQRIYDPEKECLATLKPIPLDNTVDMPFIGGDLPPGNNIKNSHHPLPPSLFSLSLSRSHRLTRPWTCPWYATGFWQFSHVKILKCPLLHVLSATHSFSGS